MAAGATPQVIPRSIESGSVAALLALQQWNAADLTAPFPLEFLHWRASWQSRCVTSREGNLEAWAAQLFREEFAAQTLVFPEVGVFHAVHAISAGTFARVVLLKEEASGRSWVVKLLRPRTSSSQEEREKGFAFEDLLLEQCKKDPQGVLAGITIESQRAFSLAGIPALLHSYGGVKLFSYSRQTIRLPVWKCAKVAQDLFKILEVLQAYNIIHADFTPNNLVVLEEEGAPQVKVIDFGTSRIGGEKVFCVSGRYITARSWRDPWVIFSSYLQCGEESDPFPMEIDWWGAAIIVTELLLQRTLFPGGNTKLVVQTISQRLGSPERSFFERLAPPSASYRKRDRIIQWLETIPQTKTLREEILEHSSTDGAVDHQLECMIRAVEKVLCWDPQDRLPPAAVSALLTWPADRPLLEKAQ